MTEKKHGAATIASLVVNLAKDAAELRRNVDAMNEQLKKAEPVCDRLGRYLTKADTELLNRLNAPKRQRRKRKYGGAR